VKEEDKMMRKALVVASLAALATVSIAIVARPAASAGAGDPRIAVLQAQVKALQAQTKTLTAQTKTLRAQLGDLQSQLNVNFAGDTCLAALSADLVQGTWGVIDQIAQAAQQKTYFGPQTQLNDYRNCENLAEPDVPRPPLATPPSLTSLQMLLQWMHE
jgi:hypothetical protein